MPAGPEDAPAMAAILGNWVAATDWMPDLHTPAQTKAFCAGLTPQTVIARGITGVLGFLARREAEILCLYVEPPGHGVGSALLAQAQAVRPRLALWTFAANTGARRFYARHGFAEIGGTAGDNDEGLPDIRLEWRRP